MQINLKNAVSIRMRVYWNKNGVTHTTKKNMNNIEPKKFL